MGDDTNPKGDEKTPEGNVDQTPNQTQTLTRDEHEVAIAKVKHDVQTDMGRLEKALAESNRIANAALTRLKAQEENFYRNQEEAAKDDPDELSRIRKRRDDDEREARIEEREAKVKTQFERITQSTAKSLARQYNVAVEVLTKYASDDPEKMEELAKSYGERKPSGETEVKQVTRMTSSPDDGKTKGGGQGLTKVDLVKMSPQERAERSAEIAKLSF